MTLAFVALVGIGTVLYDPERLLNFKPFLPHGWARLLITMGFTYVAFEGFEVIAQTGDEAIEPRRNLPKAMLYSVLIVAFTYVGVSFASIVAVKGVGEPAWVWIVGPAWVVLGIVIYYTYSRHKTIATEDEIVVLQEKPIPNKRGYRVLVAVANPANAVKLAWHCYRFCQTKRAEVKVIHMVPVPPQLPLSDACKYILAGEEAIVEAMLYLSSKFTFGSTMRYLP